METKIQNSSISKANVESGNRSEHKDIKDISIP